MELILKQCMLLGIYRTLLAAYIYIPTYLRTINYIHYIVGIGLGYIQYVHLNINLSCSVWIPLSIPALIHL